MFVPVVRWWMKLSRRVRYGVAGGMAVVLVAGLLTIPALRDALPELGEPADESSVETTTAQASKPQSDPTAGSIMTQAPPAPVWPTAAAAEIAANGSPTTVGGLPIAVTGRDSSRKVKVDVYGQDVSSALGIDGVVARLGDPGGPATVQIGYAPFATAFGADWGVRLRVTKLPECALSRPGDRDCVGSPLRTTNSAPKQTLTAALDAGSLFAVTAAPAGASGDYAATTLTSSSGWSAGSATGDFTWSYEVPIPSAWTGGPGARVGISYSSGSVDGMTAASNNQPSWVGEGFAYEPGFIERKYTGCAMDQDGGNNTEKTGDLCWFDDNAFLSYGGTATELVKDKTSGTWRPKNEDGTRIERKTGGPNADDNGEYWLVTLMNGTKLWFGRNQLPGWATGKAVTNSVWTVPVFGNQSGEPCHATSFAASSCAQAWRWQLDYIEDPHGSTTSYWYSTETNKYARNLDPNNPVTYTRAGLLDRIEYGTRNDTAYGRAPNRIEFATADRCLSNCSDHKEANWPDTPWDQECTGSTCADHYSPTFWSTRRLASVTTKVWTGTAYSKVDDILLRHSFRNPGDGTRAGLFLEGLTRTGYGIGEVPMSLPEITFGAAQLPNRVDGIDNAPAMNWFRLSSIITETGGEILVDYSEPDCVAGTRIPSEAGTNTWRCFPVYWNPAEHGDPELDWFHKYVVDTVSQIDHSGGGSPRSIVRYTYGGGGAWHYDDTNGLSEKKYRTWNQWRGYETVTTTNGDTADNQPLAAVSLFHRGMDGDRNPAGGTKTVKTVGSDGVQVPDDDVLAGRVREQRATIAATGEMVSTQFTDYYISGPTATRTIEGRDIHARYVHTSKVTASTKLNGTGTWRTTASTMVYNEYGQLVLAGSLGKLDTTSDDTCVRTTYLKNTPKWILTAVSMVETYELPCSALPSTPETVSDRDSLRAVNRFSFDGQANGVAPTVGNSTYADHFVGWTSTGPRYVKSVSTTYDAYGRPTSMTDASGDTSSTAYEGAFDGSYLDRTIHTNPLGYTQTINFERLRGQATSVIDANGFVTNYEYDPLGRKTRIWTPGQPTTATPSIEYIYDLKHSGPTTVATRSLIHNGAQVTTYTLYDSFLRQRQSQVPGVNGGRIVSDVFYDSAGRAWKTFDAYHDADALPGPDLAVPTAESRLPRIGVTLFDDYGRVTDSIFYSFGTEKWRTKYINHGDRTDVIPPNGGTVSSVLTDFYGRTSESRQYEGRTPTGPYDATTYTYDKHGNLKSWTNSSGETWSYEYDVLGRVISSSDPDSGTATAAYGDDDRLVSTTDARGEKLFYSYDSIGRPLTVREDGANGTIRTENTYDTVPDALGLPSSATRWIGGKAYISTVNDYDESYRPLSTTLTVPDGHGDLTGSYNFSQTYNIDGSPETMTYPAAGGLPEETIKFHYDATLGLPDWLGTDYPDIVTYVQSTKYTNTGLLQRLDTSGAKEDPYLRQSFWYEDGTQRLKSSAVQRFPEAPSVLTNSSYEYDDAGNITKIADYWDGTGTTLVENDVQCFRYDHLQRLTEAWTPKANDCVKTPGQGTVLGGAAPYWQSYSFQKNGNRASLTNHPVPGKTTETTTTYTYPSPTPGTDGAPGNHRLASTETSTLGSPGSFTHAYAYDQAGNTVQRPDGKGKLQNLAWDPEGHLAKVTDADNGEELGSYIYGPDGSRLLAKDKTGETLYLGGMELRDTSTAAPTARRYYGFAGSTIAIRTTENGLTWLVADHQGTNSIAISQDTRTIQHRRQDPYGNPRGAVPANWPDKKGFVGGDNDPTGLTHIGAREYDASIGRFVSDDPITSGDPQQANGYTYADNTPITASDPSGLAPKGGGVLDLGAYRMCQFYGCRDELAPGTVKECNSGFYCGVATQLTDDLLGPLEDLADGWWCATNFSACKQKVMDFANAVLAQPDQFIKDALYGIIAPIADPIRAGEWGKAIGAAAWMALAFIATDGLSTIRKNIKNAIETALKKRDGGGDGSSGSHGLPGSSGSDSPGDGSPTSSIDPGVTTGSPELPDGEPGKKKDGDEGSPEADGGTEAGSDTNGEADNSGGPKCNCFTEGTPVLLADGTSKSIEDIDVGDKVTTLNTDSGQQETHTVTALFHKTAAILVEITIQSNSSDGSNDVSDTGQPDNDTVSGTDPPSAAGQSFTVTPEHPIWEASTRTWTLAGDLQIGDRLLQEDGATPVITAIHRLEPSTPFTVYNFTVDGTHNYYATTLNTLVHNCSSGEADEVLDGLGDHVTTGQVVDGGKRIGPPVQSGENSSTSTINEFLMGSPHIENPRAGAPHPAASHVETKIAWAMRNRPVTHAVVVINNPTGVCRGIYSCSNAVPAILRSDQSMTVMFPSANGWSQVTLRGLSG
ncbi:hypothetical protein Afil01_32130 [Actinorhabdospora filicis]|uniref:Hint domain-containing protein n=1 Tax=Actinorhabdospora filicis TaxID=1785913 RepID=A0A9W6SM84_9ACTN|nr:DddA-like double-stranded DNA deaminase toxin [Actinorhabdospora filicis]GLZ78406.1 hypothetical protein Afil01_32130 [Actinorhabdospora filicis]